MLTSAIVSQSSSHAPAADIFCGGILFQYDRRVLASILCRRRVLQSKMPGDIMSGCSVVKGGTFSDGWCKSARSSVGN